MYDCILETPMKVTEDQPAEKEDKAVDEKEVDNISLQQEDTQQKTKTPSIFVQAAKGMYCICLVIFLLTNKSQLTIITGLNTEGLSEDQEEAVQRLKGAMTMADATSLLKVCMEVAQISDKVSYGDRIPRRQSQAALTNKYECATCAVRLKSEEQLLDHTFKMHILNKLLQVMT